MISQGWYERHIAVSRLRYRRRRERFGGALPEVLPETEPYGMAAGLHLVLPVPAAEGHLCDPGSLALPHRLTTLERYRVPRTARDGAAVTPAAAPAAMLVVGYGNLGDGLEVEAARELRRALTLMSAL